MATETNSPGNSILLQALTKRFDTVSQLSSWRGALLDAYVDGFAYPYKYVADSTQTADGIYQLNARGGNGSQPGRWISTSPVVSIKDYGAKGDKITDDTAAIQGAMSFGAATGSTVLMPNGTYRVTGPIVVNMGNSTGNLADGGGRRLVIEGGGASNTCLYYTESAAITVLKILGASDGQDNLTLSGFRITTGVPVLETRNSTGLDVRNLANFKFSDIRASFFDLGFQLIDAGEGAMYNSLFDHNKRGFYAGPANGIAPNGILYSSVGFNSNSEYGAFIQNGSVNTFKVCRVLRNGVMGVESSRGIKIQFDNYTGGVSSIFEGCYIEGQEGGADVEIISASEGSHLFSGTTFNRVGNLFSTYNILLTPLNLVNGDTKKNIVTLNACAFEGYGSYTPDVSRPTVQFSLGDNGYDGWIVDDTSTFKNAVEKFAYSDFVQPKFKLYDNDELKMFNVAVASNSLAITKRTNYVYISSTSGVVNTISAPKVPVGSFVSFQSDTPVTLHHNANLLLAGLNDFTFGTGQIITLYKQNTSVWREVSRSAFIPYVPAILFADKFFSGTSGQTVYPFAHGLGATPSWYSVTDCSSDAANPYWVLSDATNIYINYKTVPPTGVDNLIFKIAYRL